MGDDFRVMGADSLAAVARDIKAVADRDLKRKMLAGMRHAGEPMKDAARAAARERLPHTGGLNEFVAASTFSIRTRTTGKNVGVRLQGAKKGHDLKATDRGKLRRPVFGHTDRWVLQQIPPGWFSDAPQLSDAAVMVPVRREMLIVLEGVAKKIAGH